MFMSCTMSIFSVFFCVSLNIHSIDLSIFINVLYRTLQCLNFFSIPIQHVFRHDHSGCADFFLKFVPLCYSFFSVHTIGSQCLCDRCIVEYVLETSKLTTTANIYNNNNYFEHTSDLVFFFFLVSQIDPTCLTIFDFDGNMTLY